MKFDYARVIKKQKCYVLVWETNFNRQATTHNTLQDAKEQYYIFTAWDYLGSAIRDNSRQEKIVMGQAIEKHGVDDNGNIIWR
jgi:hypothetical protein